MLKLLALLCFLPTLALGQSKHAPDSSRPAITGLSHVSLYADDLNRSENFYTQTLGWYQQPDLENQAGVRFFANHLQYVELLPAPRPGMDDRWAGIAFSTSNVEALRVYLHAHGLSVPATVSREPDGTRSLVVQDPEGNRVEFVQAGDHAPAEPKNAANRLSGHIMHAGYVVHNRAAMDHFYKDLLGFHLYWQGGADPHNVDWVMMQVPDGRDWVEYMLYLPQHPSRAQMGSANHFAPGVLSIPALQAHLEQKGWKPPLGKDPQVVGVDGKRQLDLVDPDGTRVEFMAFAPEKTACCSAYTGPHPVPVFAW